MKSYKLRKFLKSKTFKTIALSAIIGISLSVGFITGFEKGQGMPATYKHYSSNKILATVGSTKIKVDALKKQMTMYFASQPTKKFTEEEISEKELAYIDYIISKEALKQKALEDGIVVEDEVVDAQYEDLVPQLESIYNLSIDEIYKEYDITKEYVKEAVRDELLGNSYLDKIGVSTDEEATNYYNENLKEFVQSEASHILIKTIDDEYNPLSDEEIEKARAKAERVLKKALAGEDFAQLAKTYSEDASAIEGGTLGYFGKGEMVQEFEDAAFSLKVGEVTTELVETEFGFHIIKKTGEKQSTLEESLDGIKDDLAYKKKYNLMKEILNSPDVKIEYEV